MPSTFPVVASAAGEPTWGYAMLGMLIIVVVAIGLALLLTRKK